jgi:hypothetical protein
MSEKDLKLPEFNFPKGKSKKKDKPIKDSINKSKLSIYEKADKNDEKQIELIQEGAVINEPFFETEDDNGHIKYMLTFDGVFQMAKQQGNLEVVGAPIAEHTDKAFAYLITFKDTKNNITVFARGEQDISSKYAQTKALSKTQRNGFRQLLDSKIVEEQFKIWYKNKYGKEMNSTESLIIIAKR